MDLINAGHAYHVCTAMPLCPNVLLVTEALGKQELQVSISFMTGEIIYQSTACSENPLDSLPGEKVTDKLTRKPKRTHRDPRVHTETPAAQGLESGSASAVHVGHCRLLGGPFHPHLLELSQDDSQSRTAFHSASHEAGSAICGEEEHILSWSPLASSL